MITSIHEKMEQAAYYTWQNLGCPCGCELECWNQAERKLFGFTADEFWDQIKSCDQKLVHDEKAIQEDLNLIESERRKGPFWERRFF